MPDMEELRPLIAIVGLAVVVGAITIAIARAHGRRFEWWERFMSPGRPRRTRAKGRAGEKGAKTPSRSDRDRIPRSTPSRSAEADPGPTARSPGRPRPRAEKASGRQPPLGLEDVPLLDPREGARATALDREFDMGDLSAIGAGGRDGADLGERARAALRTPAASPAPKGTPPDEPPERAGKPESAPAPQPASKPPRRPPAATKKARRPEPRSAASQSVENAEAEPHEEELLVVLTVMAPDEGHLSGARIQQAFNVFDLHPDEDGLFHHHGGRKGTDREAVFSVANALEPGVFDLTAMKEMNTPGLCMFMRRPGPLDAKVAFDLMLDIGARLASAVGGVLCDDQRCRLTVQATQALRERVIHFALRHEREVPIRK